MTAFTRTIARWVEELSPSGAEANVRRALRALYRGEAEEAWRLPELGHELARVLEERGVRAFLPAVLSSSGGDDGAEKLLLECTQGRVEAVLIPEVRREKSRASMRPEGARPRGPRPLRAAGCISTQVGCAVGCAFCASGLEGLARNLAPEDLVGQALVLAARAREKGRLLATLVFMGMGEPLHNLDALLVALENLCDVSGAGFGPSAITVSTIGILAGMERLAREGSRAPNLALSLHAPDDATRSRLVPMPRLAPVADVLAAAADYAARTRRFVTVSYVLLEGENDSLEQAEALARLLEGTGFHVNLIPWNPVSTLPFRPTPRAPAQAFWERLRARGIATHFRRARGSEAEAACGQLARRRPEPLPAPSPGTP